MTLATYPANEKPCPCGGTMRRISVIEHPGRSIVAKYRCDSTCGDAMFFGLPIGQPEVEGEDEVRKTLEAVERFAADVTIQLELIACIWPQADAGGAELRRRAFLLMTQAARMLEGQRA